MSKEFKDWDVDQRWLLPPSAEDLDLTAILKAYREERGSPPYHPVMMTALLLYAYCQGVYGSRRIARACEQRVDFMAVTGRSMPDFRTIALFRKRHRQALSELFGQVLGLCKRAGIVKLGHVAIDGTKIKAKAELEAEAAENAKKSGSKKSEPEGKAQRNFTDPESRIMKAGNGFEQCCNAQAAVDSGHQVIVAQSVTDAPNDKNQWVPMLAGIKENMGRHADEVSADTGYCSEENLKQVNRRSVNAYIATARQKHGEASATLSTRTKPGTRVHAMATKLRRGGYRSRYRLRKIVVEPVFGQIKQARGFRQFMTRGLKSVSSEWAMLCTAHNLLKLAQATS